MKPLKFIILTIILAAIVFIVFVPFINHDNGIRCITAPCPADSTSTLLAYTLFFSHYHIYQFYWTSAAIGIIISLIISSIAVYLYSYLKNKLYP